MRTGEKKISKNRYPLKEAIASYSIITSLCAAQSLLLSIGALSLQFVIGDANPTPPPPGMQVIKVIMGTYGTSCTTFGQDYRLEFLMIKNKTAEGRG